MRDILWFLKRVDDDPAEHRARYDNRMAASHVEALEAAVDDRGVEWSTPADLDRVVNRIP